MTTNRNLRLAIAVLVLGVFAAAAVAAWGLLLRPAEVAPAAAPPTTSGLTPATTRLDAADLATTTTTTPTTPTPPTTTTSTTTTTVPSTTTTTAVPTTTVPTSTTLTTATTTTTVAAPSEPIMAEPVPAGDGSCRGTYVQGGEVREQCVFYRLHELFHTLAVGSPPERLSTIRDGHVLAPMVTQLRDIHREQYPDEYDDPNSPNYSGWEDGDLRFAEVATEIVGARWNAPNLLGTLHRLTGTWAGEPFDYWSAVPVVWVDGQWMISYAAWCRNETGGRAGVSCPPDPRLEWALSIGEYQPDAGWYVPEGDFDYSHVWAW